MAAIQNHHKQLEHFKTQVVPQIEGNDKQDNIN